MKRFWDLPLPSGYDDSAILARTIILNYRLRQEGLELERREALVKQLMVLAKFEGDSRAKTKQTVAPLRAALRA